MIKPIIGRIGGKWRISKWIIEHIKRFEWSLYVEPFCGSASIYCQLLNTGISEIIKNRGHQPRFILNDMDSKIINLYRICRDFPEILIYDTYFTPYSREEHRIAKKTIYESIHGIPDYFKKEFEELSISINLISDESIKQSLEQSLNTIKNEVYKKSQTDIKIEFARKYLIENKQSHSNQGGWSFDKFQSGNNSKENIYQFNNTMSDRIFTLSNHLQEISNLKNVYLENDDFEKVCRRWDTPYTIMYLDPPYFNKETYYSEKFTKECHQRLCQMVHELNSQVIISYYPHPDILAMYSENDWEFHFKSTIASSASITKNNKTKTQPKNTELLLIKKS